MAARSGMEDLITALRGMANAGTLDYSIDGTPYWTDDQLQLILDRNRKDIYHEELSPITSFIGGGSVSYQIYRSRWIHLEGGTVNFALQDGLGAAIGTASYTADLAQGVFTFGADTGGTPVYLVGRAYDLDGAAAAVWRQKAGHASKLYSFSTKDHTMQRAQWFANCQAMADIYESAAWPTQVSVGRSDDIC